MTITEPWLNLKSVGYKILHAKCCFHSMPYSKLVYCFTYYAAENVKEWIWVNWVHILCSYANIKHFGRPLFIALFFLIIHQTFYLCRQSSIFFKIHVSFYFLLGRVGKSKCHCQLDSLTFPKHQLYESLKIFPFLLW